MKEVKWFREVVEREESKTRSFEKSRYYLQWLIDKYNKLSCILYKVLNNSD